MNKLNELINSYYENNSEEIKNEIILKSMSIIDTLIEKHKIKESEKEELYAILSLELVEAVNNYLQNNLKTNYYQHIYYKLDRIIIKEKEPKEIQLESLDSLTNYYVKTIDELGEAIDLEREIKILLEVLESLEEREKDIIKMGYGIEYPQSYSAPQIGKKHNLNHRTISTIEKKQLRLLRKILDIKLNNPEASKRILEENITDTNEIIIRLSSNQKLIVKTKELLKEYSETKNEKIKQEILKINKKRIRKIVEENLYKDISFDEAYTLACKTYYNSIDTFIELSKTNDKINFFIYTDTLIKDKIKELSNNYIYNRNINNLIYFYGRANDDNTKELILERIIEISNQKINNIIQSYAYLNIPYEDLRNIVVEQIKQAVKTYFNKKETLPFGKLSEKVKNDIDNYIALKSNEHTSSLESEKTLKI